jgi:hypothetical protein
MNEHDQEDAGISPGYEEFPATKQGKTRVETHTINWNEME